MLLLLHHAVSVDLDVAWPAATIWGEDEINLQRKDAITCGSNIRTAVEIERRQDEADPTCDDRILAGDHLS